MMMMLMMTMTARHGFSRPTHPAGRPESMSEFAHAYSVARLPGSPQSRLECPYPGGQVPWLSVLYLQRRAGQGVYQHGSQHT